MRFWRPYQPALDEAYRSLADSFGDGNLVPDDEQFSALEERIVSFPEHHLGHMVLVPSASVGFFLLLKSLQAPVGVLRIVASNFMHSAMFEASLLAGADTMIVDSGFGWRADLYGMESNYEILFHTDLVGQQSLPADVDLPKNLVGLTTVQDGSQVFGRDFKMWADAAIFSFGATKNPFGLVGAIASRDATLVERIRELRSAYTTSSLGGRGLNFNLSTLQTALLSAGLNHFDQVEELCARIVARYRAHFRDRIVHIGEVRNSSYAPMYALGLSESFVRHYVKPLRENSVRFPVSCELAQGVVCLPVYADMSSEEVAFVIDKVKEAVR